MNSRSLDGARKEIFHFMATNWNRKTRQCPQCGKTFTSSSRAHFFCKGGSCYAKYHRIPGQIRVLIKKMMD